MSKNINTALELLAKTVVTCRAKSSRPIEQWRNLEKEIRAFLSGYDFDTEKVIYRKPCMKNVKTHEAIIETILDKRTFELKQNHTPSDIILNEVAATQLYYEHINFFKMQAPKEDMYKQKWEIVNGGLLYGMRITVIESDTVEPFVKVYSKKLDE